MNAIDEIPVDFFDASSAEGFPVPVTARELMAEAAELVPTRSLRRIVRDATRLRCPGAGSCFAAQAEVFPRWASHQEDWQAGVFLGDLGVVSHAMRMAAVSFFQAEADARNAAAGLVEAARPAWEALVRDRWKVDRDPAPFQPLYPGPAQEKMAGTAGTPASTRPGQRERRAGGDKPRPVRVGDLLAVAGDSTRGTRISVKVARAARRHCPGGEDVFALLKEWADRCTDYPDDPAPVIAGVHLRRIDRAMRRATALWFQEEADDLNAAAGTVEPERVDWPELFRQWDGPHGHTEPLDPSLRAAA